MTVEWKGQAAALVRSVIQGIADEIGERVIEDIECNGVEIEKAMIAGHVNSVLTEVLLTPRDESEIEDEDEDEDEEAGRGGA